MKRLHVMAAMSAAMLLAGTIESAFATPGGVGDFNGATGVSKGQGAAANASTGGSLGTAGLMMINAPTVQSFAFSNGTDTNQMQYSGSQGQTNAFSVGASNSAGISSSVQSTQEYNGKSTANLTLAAGCEQRCPSTALTNVIGVAEQAYNTSERAAAFSASAETSASASVGASYEVAQGRGFGGTKAQYEANYKAAYDTAYSAAATSSSSASQGVQNQSGIVGGTFSSTSTGSSSAGTTGSGTMNSNSEVELKGVGAKSTLAAGSNSSFATEITRNTGVTGSADMASANASAGLNLGTNASASSNASSFSSVFVSAF